MMLKRHGGVLTCDGPHGSESFDTFTCWHCQRIVALTQRAARSGIIGNDNMDEVGATCGCCGRAVCLACSLTRDPWMAQLDRMEQEAYRRAQNAKVMGL